MLHLGVTETVSDWHAPVLSLDLEGDKPIATMALLDRSVTNSNSRKFEIREVATSGAISGRFSSENLLITNRMKTSGIFAGIVLPYIHRPTKYDGNRSSILEIFFTGNSRGIAEVVWLGPNKDYLQVFHNIADPTETRINFRYGPGNVVSEPLSSEPVFEKIPDTGFGKYYQYEYYSEVSPDPLDSHNWSARLSTSYEGMPVLAIRNTTDENIDLFVTSNTISISTTAEVVNHDSVYIRQLVAALNRLPGIEAVSLVADDMSTRIIEKASKITLTPINISVPYNEAESNIALLYSRHVLVGYKADSGIALRGIFGDTHDSWVPMLNDGSIFIETTVPQEAKDFIEDYVGFEISSTVGLMYTTNPGRVMGLNQYSDSDISVYQKLLIDSFERRSIKLPYRLLLPPYQKLEDITVYLDGQSVPSGMIESISSNMITMLSDLSIYRKVEVAGRFILDSTIYRGFTNPNTGEYQTIDLNPLGDLLRDDKPSTGVLVFLYPDLVVFNSSTGDDTILRTQWPVRHKIIDSSDLSSTLQEMGSFNMEVPSGFASDIYGDFGRIPTIPVAYYRTTPPGILTNLSISDVQRSGGGLPSLSLEEARRTFGPSVESLFDYASWDGLSIPTAACIYLEVPRKLGRARRENAKSELGRFALPGNYVATGFNDES